MPAARGHPLRVPFADHATTAVRVVVRDLAVEDVAYSLEAAMWVPGCALGFVRLVHLRALCG